MSSADVAVAMGQVQTPWVDDSVVEASLSSSSSSSLMVVPATFFGVDQPHQEWMTDAVGHAAAVARVRRHSRRNQLDKIPRCCHHHHHHHHRHFHFHCHYSPSLPGSVAAHPATAVWDSR